MISRIKEIISKLVVCLYLSFLFYVILSLNIQNQLNQAPFLVNLFYTFENLIINQIQINNHYINCLQKMKITVKTLKGQMMQIDVQPATTIMELKQKVKQLKGFEIQGQKIVFKGKATTNQDTIQKLNIKQKDFLVVMTTVKKPQSKKQQTKKVEQQKQQKTEQKKQVKQEAKPQKKQAQPKPQDPQFENKINELMNMGFSRQKCTQALRAAFGNSQVAVEYLLNGIPAGLVGQQGQGGMNPMSALMGGSQFEQLRQILRNDPSQIQPILQQLAQTSPQIYNLISQHPQQFQQMLMGEGQGEGDEQFEVQESMQPQGQEIVVSQAEQQAIQRLAALGFSKVQAAQAYLACDKNQQMAANLLFDRLANGDIQQGAFQDQEGDDDNLFN